MHTTQSPVTSMVALSKHSNMCALADGSHLANVTTRRCLPGPTLSRAFPTPTISPAASPPPSLGLRPARPLSRTALSHHFSPFSPVLGAGAVAASRRPLPHTTPSVVPITAAPSVRPLVGLCSFVCAPSPACII